MQRLFGGRSLLSRLAPLSEDDETEETVLLLKVLGDNVSHVDERAHEHLLRMVRADPPSPLCAWRRSAASTHASMCTPPIPCSHSAASCCFAMGRSE